MIRKFRIDNEHGYVLLLSSLVIGALVAVVGLVIAVLELTRAKDLLDIGLREAALKSFQYYQSQGIYTAGGLNAAALKATEIFQTYANNSGMLASLVLQGDNVSFQVQAAVPDDTSPMVATLTPGRFLFVEDDGSCGMGPAFAPCFVPVGMMTRATAFKLSLKIDNDILYTFPLPGFSDSTGDRLNRSYATASLAPLEIAVVVDGTSYLTSYTHHPFQTTYAPQISSYAYRIDPAHMTNPTCPLIPANNLWPNWDAFDYPLLPALPGVGRRVIDHAQSDYSMCLDIASGLGMESYLFDMTLTTSIYPQPLRQVLDGSRRILGQVANNGVPGDSGAFIFHDVEQVPGRDELETLTAADIINPGNYKTIYDALDPSTPMQSVMKLFFPRRIDSTRMPINLDLPAALNRALTTFQSEGIPYADKRLVLFTQGMTTCTNGAGTCQMNDAGFTTSMNASLGVLQNLSAAGVKPYVFLFGDAPHTLLRKKGTHCATEEESAKLGYTITDNSYTWADIPLYGLMQLTTKINPDPINGHTYMMRPCCSTDGIHCTDVNAILDAACAGAGMDGSLVTSVPGVVLDQSGAAAVDSNGRLLCDPDGWWWSDRLLQGIQDASEYSIVMPE